MDVVDLGMNPEEAVESPRFNSEALYSTFDAHDDQPLTLDIERRFEQTVLDSLRARGHKLVLGGDWSNPIEMFKPLNPICDMLHGPSACYPFHMCFQFWSRDRPRAAFRTKNWCSKLAKPAPSPPKLLLETP